MLLGWFLALMYWWLKCGWGDTHFGFFGGGYMAWTIAARLGRWALLVSLAGYAMLIPFAALSTPLVGR